jgi:hypothetical protein
LTTRASDPAFGKMIGSLQLLAALGTFERNRHNDLRQTEEAPLYPSLVGILTRRGLDVSLVM